jgi:phosphoglycerate dehydrogenase-like enzyme
VASTARKQAPFVEVGSLDALPQLVGEADYLINLLPDTPATRDRYDAQLFACCKPGALFINAGRGSAVVDVDLVQALEAGRLGGAVIDVCREEPPAPDHPFWQASRLLLTGHTAAPTDPRLLVQVFLDNLARWQAGEALRGEVDFDRGY